MIGQMRHTIEIISTESSKDHQGVTKRDEIVLKTVRAYKESQHGNEKWRNRAAFSMSDTLFRFRTIPNFKVTTSMYIKCDGERYNIFSVEDVRGRGMYVEVLSEKTSPSKG